MEHFAIFRSYVCTANPDGSIPLNSKVACEAFSREAGLFHQLIAQANLAVDLVKALDELQLDAPALKEARIKYERGPF
jgi:hypothetical protein